MSLYRGKLGSISKIRDGKMSNLSIPLNYIELIRRDSVNSVNDSTITMNMIITNLNTQEDYESIATILKQIKGVKAIGVFQLKKIGVTFNRYETSLENIVHHLSKMGYKYINRFWQKC